MATAARHDSMRVVPEGRDSEKASKAMAEIRKARGTRRRRRTTKLAELELPTTALNALEVVLEGMAEGRTVLVSKERDDEEDMTTTEAADDLGMSRPTLIKLLNAGEIPYRMVGTHRRLRRSDVLAYREKMERPQESPAARRRRRLKRLQEMAEISHEAGEGY